MQQADHAALFGQTGRAVMAALVEFARGLEPQFTPEETARMVAAAGAWLLVSTGGAEHAATVLRGIADMIAAGKPPTTN